MIKNILMTCLTIAPLLTNGIAVLAGILLWCFSKKVKKNGNNKRYIYIKI